jgi:hypothetical protein
MKRKYYYVIATIFITAIIVYAIAYNYVAKVGE